MHLDYYKVYFAVDSGKSNDFFIDDLGLGALLFTKTFCRMGHEDGREYQGVTRPTILYPVEGFHGPST